MSEREINETIAVWISRPYPDAEIELMWHVEKIWIVADGHARWTKLFTRSLDSMALAEAKLTPKQARSYMTALIAATPRELRLADNTGEKVTWRLVTAPASIRAAALCEVIKQETP